MLLQLNDALPAKYATVEMLGGKGHGIAWMTSNGLPVPMAFCIPTTICAEYQKAPVQTMNKLLTEIPGMLKAFEKEFGYIPLLSVRSGARVSMPGMMDTILNVGLDKETFPAWRERLGDACATDSYKRLLVMHGSVVHGIERKKLEQETFELTWSAYKQNVEVLHKVILEGMPSTLTQILTSIEAVFKSWDNERAKMYRKLNNIPEEWGTAVVIQAMVFGNMNDNSGTGVLFTRNPDTGANEVLGEFLTNAQGEDVVDGSHTPLKLPEMANWNDAVYKQLLHSVHQLEVLKKDVQDVEFTIQDGKLYFLQTRNAKRSPRAACKIAIDMVNSGLITPEEALKRCDARTIDLAFQPTVDPKFKNPAQYNGIPACSGVVSGRPVFSAADAVEAAGKGEAVILVTDETDPDDIAGMFAAVGIITMNGGSTSHAAVVARSMNRACIVGVGHETINFMVEKISMDGSTGRIWFEEVPIIGGHCAEAEELRRFAIKKGAVIVTTAPKQSYPALCYDLSANMHYELPGVLLEVIKVAGMCNQLHLLMSPYEAAPEIVQDFMTKAMYEERAKALFELLEDVTAPFSTIGFQMKGKPSQATATMGSLEDLVLMDASQDVLFMPPTTTKAPSAKLKKALDKVQAWLKKDGVEFKQMNNPGGFAALSVHLHG